MAFPSLRHSRLRAILPATMALLIAFAGKAQTLVYVHATDEDDARFFRERVEPILRNQCFPCHSHAAGAMEGGLALDWKSGWVQGGSRGPAILPGQPHESLLVRAIQHRDPELRMPERRLPDGDIQTLIQWIERGAFDDREVEPASHDPNDWWSLKPLIAPPIPNVPSQHPIDAFIDARLAEVGLSRSPQASPRERIRRLAFDLHGLPPSPEDVERFVADPSPQAYLELVDSYLESPRYAERWARHWLDTIHFADSHGYEHDVGRDHAWPYRDWVISALHRDLSWSTFLRHQLAVDVFEPDATDWLPALGFLGAGTFDLSTYSTGPVTFDYLDRDDLVTQTMSAMLSTTANCARCHAHKFDPISQEDYYALQAVFAGILKGDISYDADRNTAAQRRRLIAIRDAEASSPTLRSEFAQQLIEAWLTQRGPGARWHSMPLQSYVSLGGATLTQSPDGTLLASGTNPDTDTYVLTAKPSLQRITALRLELFPHESLPMRGPGRCQNGNLHLSEIALYAFPPEATGAGPEAGRPIAIAQAVADFNQAGWGIERAIDGDTKTAWGIHPAVGEPHQAVFELAEPLVLPPGSALTVVLRQLHGGSHLIGSLRMSATDADAAAAIPLAAHIEGTLAIPRSERTAEQQSSLVAAVAKLAAESELAKLPAPSKVFAAGTSVAIPAGNGKDQLGAIAAPKVVHVLQRGDFQKPLQSVAPGALSALMHAPSRFEAIAAGPESARRAALAEWMVHPENPLTWRSAVNRVWHYHFGRGLCDTPSDFGRMGGVPSHPELIDWLAVWFRDAAGGSLKALHRSIVTSQTYQQSCESREDGDRIDAQNRLLWRQHRLRLDADAYRDYVLAVSGRLDLTMGGPAIQQFHQRPGPQATPILDYTAYDWSTPGANRRSIYRYVWRGIPDPMMAVLDFPDLGLLAPVRGFSASPLQSLTLSNHPFVLHHSQAMAERIEAATEDVAERVRRAVRDAWQREPNAEEMERMGQLVRTHGLAALCRVLFNSNEFLFQP